MSGSLIALMLGRLEMGVEECINAYVELSKEIFPKEATGKKNWWNSTVKFAEAYRGKSWFKADALERCLQKTITAQLGEAEVDQDFLTESQSCKV
jgi:hypothetical protein